MANIYVPWKSVGEESERVTVSEGDTINNVEEVKGKKKKKEKQGSNGVVLIYSPHVLYRCI